MKVSAPAPDPGVGQAAKDNAAIGARQMDLAERSYNDQQALYEEFAPLLREQLQLSATEQGKTIERGDVQWGSYEKIFAPLEAKMAETSANFDTAGRREQVAGEAVGQVASAFDTARAGTRRALADAGVKVGSGATAALDAQSRIEQAKTSAGAANTARNQVEMQGLSLVDNAARFGRNMPSTGLATAQLAGQQGQGVQQGYGALTGAAAQPGMMTSGMLGQAAGSNASAANIYLNQFGAQQQGRTYRNNLVGDILGAGANVAGMFMSSEKVKKVGGKVDGKRASLAVAKSPAKEWAYKPGLGDGSTKPRMGPTAESLAKVAPEVSDGKQVDGISMLGMHHAAIGDNTKRLARIERKLGLADATTRKAA